MHLFLATGAQQIQSAAYDDAEELHIELLHRNQVVEAIANGQIGNLAGACTAAIGLLTDS